MHNGTIFDFEKALELRDWFGRVNAILEAGEPTIQCAWCATILRDGRDGSPVISHGICQPCEAKHFGSFIATESRENV